MGPKLSCWPAGGQVEAKNGLKIGPKRAFFRGTAKIPPKYVKKRLFAFGGAFVLVKRHRAHCRWHLWRQNVAVHRF